VSFASADRMPDRNGGERNAALGEGQQDVETYSLNGHLRPTTGNQDTATHVPDKDEEIASSMQTVVTGAPTREEVVR
jgi:hypothetical protein